MGIIKGIEEWQEQQGENIGDFAQNTLNKVGGFICGLRRKYPNTFFDRSFGRGLANSICANFDESPLLPEEPSFSGGQCLDSQYTVTVQFDRYTDGNFIQSQEIVFNSVPGAIQGVVATRTRGNPSVAGVLVVVEPEPENLAIVERPVGGIYDAVEITGFQVKVNPGYLDNCGNAPPSFPPDLPRDSGDFSTTAEVCEYADDGTPIYCEDVTIQLDEKDKYDFPICVTVDGKKICLDADGWSIEDAPEKDEEEKKEEFDEIEVLEAVTVTINELPTKFNKRITRENAKDTEIFAGYLAWSKVIDGSEFFYPAIPIRKEKNIFIPPEGVQTYSVYYNFNLSGVVREIKKKVKVPKQTELADDTI